MADQLKLTRNSKIRVVVTSVTPYRNMDAAIGFATTMSKSGKLVKIYEGSKLLTTLQPGDDPLADLPDISFSAEESGR